MSEEQKASTIKATHKDLYGILMTASRCISNVGTFSIFFLGAAALGLCVAIHMRWFDYLAGIPVDKLRGWGVYAVIITVAFILFIIHLNIRGNQVYRQFKPRILRSIQEADMTVESLLTDIADDKALSDVKEKLMEDKNIGDSQRMRLD